MESFLQDLRFSFRLMAKNPGLTAVMIFTLALGIGANTAIFSVVNAVLLRSLPIENPEQVVTIFESSQNVQTLEASPADFIEWRDHNGSLQDIAAYYTRKYNLQGGAQPEVLDCGLVSPNLFQLLGANAIEGRLFLPQEGEPGATRVAILSDALWKRHFGADPGVVGKPINLNGADTIVVGIMPPEFMFPFQGRTVDLWLPLVFAPNQLRNREHHFLYVIARMKPGVTVAQAQADLDVINSRLQQEFPQTNESLRVKTVPIREQVVGNLRLALMILSGAVGFVLLIACVNVTNLLLSKASSRLKEMAIRTAIGASRGRLIRQLLTEGVIISLAGGILGLVLAAWGTKLLIGLAPSSLPRISKVETDAGVLTFTLLTTALTGILYGLVPALQASKPDLNETLKDSGRTSTEGGSRRLGNLLVVSELALSVVLLIGAGLLIRSFLRLQEVNPGFNPQDVLTMQIRLAPPKYTNATHATTFYREFLERMGRLPGVVSVGSVSHLPLSDMNLGLNFTIQGQPPDNPRDLPEAEFRSVSPSYFDTMDIPFMKGRAFTEADDQNQPPVAIVNETLARRFFANVDPVGQNLNIEGEQTPRQIVGVVADVKHFGLAADAKPEVYAPFPQRPFPFMAFVFRASGDTSRVAASVRNEILTLDRDQPLSNIKTMEQYMSESLSRPRFNTFLLSLFAALALVLSVIGIYSLMSYSVTQRSREIGIRMALGAQPMEVLKLMFSHGVKLSFAGVMIGVVAALALTRLLSTLLYEVSATDPIAFVGVPLLLMLVVLAAIYIPSRRATKVDPLIALRNQ
jgi:putative ABC transport system permease protein